MPSPNGDRAKRHPTRKGGTIYAKLYLKNNRQKNSSAVSASEDRR